MNNKGLIIVAVLIFRFFTSSAQQSKFYSAINFADNGRVAYYDSALYTGKVFDTAANGRHTYEAFYKNGLLDGTATEWNSNGQKLSEINYANGKKDGKAVYYDASGKESQEINYKNDALSGDWTTFRNGIKRTVTTYINDSTSTEDKVFSADGKPDSVWHYYTPDGKLLLKTESYADGVKEGQWVTYDEKGNATTTYYHNGIEDKNARYLVRNYIFNSEQSYLIKIPVSSQLGAFGEFIFDNPMPRSKLYVDFINQVADYMVKLRGTKFIKMDDVDAYNNDTIAYIINLENIHVVVSNDHYPNGNGGYTNQYKATVDADLVTTDTRTNAVNTVHIHSNNPDIGISHNSPDWAFSSALDRDEFKSTMLDFMNDLFPLKGILTDVVKSSSKGEATLVTLNMGAQNFIKEDMRFKFSGNDDIELRVKDLTPDHCICKVLSGGDKIADMIKEGIHPVFVLEKEH